MADAFTIASRDGMARTGTLHTPHGDVATPAFVPLATRGAVRTVEPHKVEALGYEMVLGNTFHLFLAPGHELIRRQGGLHTFMRWERRRSSASFTRKPGKAICASTPRQKQRKCRSLATGCTTKSSLSCSIGCTAAKA